MIKNPPVNVGDAGLIPGSGRSPGEGNWLPTPVFLPGKSQDQGGLQSIGHKRVRHDLATKQQQILGGAVSETPRSQNIKNIENKKMWLVYLFTPKILLVGRCFLNFSAIDFLTALLLSPLTHSFTHSLILLTSICWAVTVFQALETTILDIQHW